MGSLGTSELIILVLGLALLAPSVVAFVRAIQAGRSDWAIGIGVSVVVWPVSFVLALIYLIKVHPAQQGA
jgi:hypothetical protein